MRPSSKNRAIVWALAASLFLIVLGLRWDAVNRYDTDLPQWDQWDAEAGMVLIPWLDHQLGVGNFLAPHNEHRIVMTKLANFALTVVNGQWDQRLECAVNAVLPAAIAAAFFLIGCRQLGRRWHAPLFLLLAAAYALPLSWQNFLGGLHSAQFYLIITAFGAVVWLPERPAWSPGWWLGAVCAVISLGTLATGFFAAVVVVVVLALRLLHKETSVRSAAPALLLCALIIAVGWGTQAPSGGDEILRAQNFDDFFLSIFKSLQWPAPNMGGIALALWLPWAWLSCRVARTATGTGRPFGYLLGGLGFWVLLQIVATAYARGLAGWGPASRYVDTLAFGLAVNGIAIAWLWEHGALTHFGRGVLATLGVTWAIAFGTGAFQFSAESFRVMRGIRSDVAYGEQNTRNYLATRDPAYLRHREIPYPDIPTLLIRLQHRKLLALLPESVRVPMPVESAGAPGAFIEHDSRMPERSQEPDAPEKNESPGFPPDLIRLPNNITWGSFGEDGAGATGEWESAPLPAPLAGWLKFEVAGQPDGQGMALELRDAATRAVLRTVHPDKEPGDSWRSAYVRAPHRAFIIAARDANRHLWLAFSRPVEMGTLSYLAWRGVKNGLLLAEIAAAAAALFGLLAWRETRGEKAETA